MEELRGYGCSFEAMEGAHLERNWIDTQHASHVLEAKGL